MAHVLVIEDEGVLRSAMVRALAKLPAVESVGAGNLSDALASIDEQVPDLILSDLDLPDRSGIELIGELKGRGLSVPIVFISAYLEAYGAQIPPHSGVRVLEKPVGVDELRSLVLEQLRKSESGSAVSPFAAVDYLQLAAMGGHSVEVVVDGAGDRGGTVFVHRGEIWHAEDSEGEGREALIRLLDMESASATCRTSRGTPGARSVDGRLEELLLDAARISDESTRGSDAAPDFDLDVAFDLAGDPGHASSGDPDPSAVSEQPEADDGFAAAMERGLEALLEKDYEAAHAAFLAAQAIRPDDGVVGANIRRLRDMGYGQSETTGVESE